MFKNATMVTLGKEMLLGKGMMRSCYRSPEDEKKCIKVYRKELKEHAHQKEIREIKRLRKRKHSLIIPDYYGEVETNLGTGFVFDLVENGNRDCLTLKKWLAVNPEKAPLVRETLYRDLVQSAAVFAELTTGNIMVVEEGDSLKYAVVDGLGEGTLIKICSTIPYFARRKCERKWVRLEREINEIAQAQG